jgi:uncharacterized RDD family membrane protein YckC
MECPHCHNQVRTHAKKCQKCGGAIPSGQHLLEECGLTDPAPAAASAEPTSSVSSSSSSRFRLARLGDRFIAFVLDIALLFGLFAIADAWVFMRWGVLEGNELQLTAASLVIALTLNTALLFLYGWLLEAAFGATLGKALVGIRIVRTSERGRLSASAIRNVLRIVDGFGLYLVGTAVAACSNVRQRIGDICAQTAVIEGEFGIGVRLSAMVLWVATLAGAVWVVPRICSTNSSLHTPYLNQVVVRIGQNENSVYVRIAGVTLDMHYPGDPEHELRSSAR